MINNPIALVGNYDINNVPFTPLLSQIDRVTGCLTIITKQTIYEKYGLEILSPTNLIEVYDEADLINSTNKYLVLWDMGQIKFSPNLEGEQIFFKYNGKMAMYLSADRVFTVMDNNGNITETLKSLLSKMQESIDLFKTANDMVTLSTTMKLDLENAQNITSILENDVVVANQSKTALETSTASSIVAKNNLDGSIDLSATKKSALDGSITLSDTKKSALDSSITASNTAKASIDSSITNANTTKTTLITATDNGTAKITEINNKLTDADSKIAELDDATASANITTMKADIEAIKTGKQDITDNSLNTINKTVSGAINEVVTNIGSLNGLQTSAKVVVSAINEVNTSKESKIISYKTTNGSSWYRKYSDGRLEQGGWIDILSSKTSGACDATITFAVPFVGTKESIRLSANGAPAMYDQNWRGSEAHAISYSTSLTQGRILFLDIDVSIDYTLRCWWEAKGWWK
jgi:hypothetical protein